MISGCLSRNVGILIVNKLIPEERHFVTVEKIHYILNRQSEKHFNNPKSTSTEPQKSDSLTRQIVQMVIQLSVLIFILGWCFAILSPFFTPIIWGIIITITIYPAFVKLSNKLGDRKKLASLILTLALLAAINCTGCIFVWVSY